MNVEELLRGIKDDLEYCQELAEGKTKDYSQKGFPTISSEAASKYLKGYLTRAIKKIDAQLVNSDVQARCGLYLSDGRQYGYTFEQLRHLLDEYQNPDSVFYKYKRGFPSLLKWLYEVSGTSIGDLHGDLFKHVVATYHRPTDYTDEEYDALYKKYDKFWADVHDMLGYEKIK